MLITRQGYDRSLYGMPLHIVWSPTYHCNYTCSYCSQISSRPAAKDWLDLEKTKKVFENIFVLNRDAYILTITGGEPGTFPHLADVLKYVGELYGSKLRFVHLASNGSKNPKLYETIADISARVPVNLNISIHTEHAVQDDIRSLVQILSERTPLIFNLMFNPAMREGTASFVDMLLELREKYPFLAHVQTLRDAANGNVIDPRYNEDDFKWQESARRKFRYVNKYADKPLLDMKSFDSALLNRGHDGRGGYSYERLADRDNAFKAGKFNLAGMYCVQGTHLLAVQPDGRAHNAICGEAKASAWPLYTAPPDMAGDFCRIAQCKSAACGCASNEYLQKFASLEEAEDFLMFFKANQARRIRDRAQEAVMEERLEAQEKLLAWVPAEEFVVCGVPAYMRQVKHMDSGDAPASAREGTFPGVQGNDGAGPEAESGNVEDIRADVLNLERNNALIALMLESFDRDADGPAKATPALLSKLDRAIYHYYASQWQGGDMVDAGALVGGSTRALVSGTRNFPNPPKIRVFDWFKSGGTAYMKKWLAEKYGCDEVACEDFRHIFFQNCRDCLDRLDMHIGDISKSAYVQDNNLYFLGIDCCKTLDLVYPLIRLFFPQLKANNSYVVHQDYFNGGHPYIHISMELLSSYFQPELDGGKAADSFVFKCITPIPRHIIEQIFAEKGSPWYYRIDENMQLFENIQSRVLYPRSKLMIGCAKAIYLNSVGRNDEAREAYTRAKAAWPDIPLSDWFAQTIFTA